MAIFYPHTVQCACGETATVALADAVNAGRNPEFRAQIIGGKFHRFACPACKRDAVVEKSFLYSDSRRDTFILVKPRQDRHLWKMASTQLEEVAARVPEHQSPIAKRNLRVAFGLSELREKLVAQDLQLDDRGVEYLKVRIVHEHPFLLRRPRLRLALDRADQDKLEFVAAYDLDDASFRVAIPFEESAKLANDTAGFTAWSKDANHKAPIGAAGDYWVNMWRWSAQPSALDQLKAYANAVRGGQALNPNDTNLKRMLERLPRGDVLPTWAKQDLQILFDAARKLNAGVLQDAIFEVRFAKALDDEWATNADADDIDTLWKLMKTLPASHVEGNAAINEIKANTADGSSWYNPQTHDIYISSRLVSNKENFEDTVRHEVGHGVHEDRKALVDAWLEREFGWKMWPANPAGVNAWVALMGGWAQWGVSQQQRTQVANYIAQWAGPGSRWTPNTSPNVPAGHPWWRPDFGPRLACEKTSPYWYRSYGNWHRANGRAFFINYWYGTVAVVNETALDLVARMPSNYAAMSPFEFFAEIYALYYDLDDPMRPVVPTKIIDWLNSNLGDQYRPTAMPAAPTREAFEDIARPATGAPAAKTKPKRKKKTETSAS